MAPCSEWHYCQGASDCPDCPSKHKNPLQYTSVFLPSGKYRKTKIQAITPQLDLFGGIL